MCVQPQTAPVSSLSMVSVSKRTPHHPLGPAVLAVSALLSYQTLPVTTSARRSWSLERIVTLMRDVASARMEASVLTVSVQLGQKQLLPLQPPLPLSQLHALQRIQLVSVF